jgi:hypothetical protein
MVAYTLDDQLTIDLREWDAGLGPLRGSLNNRDNAVDLQPNAETSSALDEARALAYRPDLRAGPLTMGGRKSRNPQSNGKLKGDPEFERLLHRDPSQGTGRRYAFKEV